MDLPKRLWPPHPYRLHMLSLLCWARWFSCGLKGRAWRLCPGHRYSSLPLPAVSVLGQRSAGARLAEAATAAAGGGGRGLSTRPGRV